LLHDDDAGQCALQGRGGGVIVFVIFD
jgi:hypothetical protein